jgi:hypothetical protein
MLIGIIGTYQTQTYRKHKLDGNDYDAVTQIIMAQGAGDIIDIK